MRNRIALLCLPSALSACSVFADVSAQANSFDEPGMQSFGDYLSAYSNSGDGGEIQFKFTEEFARRVPDGCSVVAHVKIYNSPGSFARWSQIASVSFVGLSAKALMSQSFYVAGLGEDLMIELVYLGESGCDEFGGEVKFRLPGSFDRDWSAL